MRRRSLVGVVIVALGFGILVPTQRHINAERKTGFDEHLLYLPQKDLLTHFTAGLNGVVADVLWLKCIQYTMRHFKTDSKFTWLNQMCIMVTTLDPYFVDAYRYGGIFLAALKADDDASLKLLERGAIKNPDRWELPYEMATVYLLNRREEPGSAKLAARYMMIAAETGTAPKSVVEFAADLSAQHNLGDLEASIWQNMLHSPQKMMRELAARKLKELALRSDCVALTRALAVYRGKVGSPARRLSDLVSAGVVRALPTDPLGGSFIIDAAGKVQATTLLKVTMKRRLNELRADLREFRHKEGRWPKTLEEMKENGVTAFIPAYPYAGGRWTYDAQTGHVK